MGAILNDLQIVITQNFLAIYTYIIYNTKLHMLTCSGTFVTAIKQIFKLCFVLPSCTHIFYKYATFRLHKSVQLTPVLSALFFIGITGIFLFANTDRQ
jgi:hypothetical protein